MPWLYFIKIPSCLMMAHWMNEILARVTLTVRAIFLGFLKLDLQEFTESPLWNLLGFFYLPSNKISLSVTPLETEISRLKLIYKALSGFHILALSLIFSLGELSWLTPQNFLIAGLNLQETEFEAVQLLKLQSDLSECSIYC